MSNQPFPDFNFFKRVNSSSIQEVSVRTGCIRSVDGQLFKMDIKSVL